VTASDAPLDVWIGTDFAGRLHSVDGRALTFAYDESYRNQFDATPMSMSMPLTRPRHSTAVVTGFFEALLPEQGQARARLELESGVSRTNTFGLLEYVGRDLPGAVAVVRAGAGLPTGGTIEPLTDAGLAERVVDLRRSAATGGATLSEHGQWSLAGAQAKLALTFADGSWGIPSGEHPTTHIVKPAIPGFECFDAYEVVCLRAARNLGMSAAQAWLQPLVDGTHAAVVVRYDRVIQDDGAVLRVHQEDLCQALGYPAWQKYERDGGPGLARAGALISRLPAQHRASSARRLLDALAFNYGIAGTDGHARNFSLLLSGADVVLAPLYDLNSALPYTRPHGARFDSVRKLHSSFVIGTTDAFTRVTEHDWATVGGFLGVAADETLTHVRRILDGAAEAMAKAASDVAAESHLEVALEWPPLIAAFHGALAFA
jgi:serine/threonine-protein kinase HipA